MIVRIPLESLTLLAVKSGASVWRPFGVSPFPSRPWHLAQYLAKFEAASVGLAADTWLVGVKELIFAPAKKTSKTKNIETQMKDSFVQFDICFFITSTWFVFSFFLLKSPQNKILDTP